jgi:hypothetical protein
MNTATHNAAFLRQTNAGDACQMVPGVAIRRRTTTYQEIAMPQFAMITGDVTYTPGDGTPIEIPRVRVEVALQPDSATLSWDAGDGVAAVTAIPRIQFDDYVKKGKIKLIE